MIDTIISFFYFSFFLIGLIAIFSYLALIGIQNYILSVQNFRVKYNAQWALVTGGSSGIGLALVEKLASQGINVVIAALDDRLLTDSVKEMKGKYPNLEFRSVGVNLSSSNPDTYMEPLKEVTKDINVSLVFNNAGYILVSLFNKTDVSKHISNYNCNATAAIYITHEFTRRMAEKGIPGLVAFTSSSGGFLPTPMTAMYSATKTFLTTFGASLAGELADDKIDVVVVHPSPIASNFYSNTSLLNTVSAFQKHAVPPSVIADVIFATAGRLVIADQGFITVFMRCVTKVLDWNLFTIIMTAASRYQPDFKRVKASHNKKST